MRFSLPVLALAAFLLAPGCRDEKPLAGTEKVLTEDMREEASKPVAKREARTAFVEGTEAYHQKRFAHAETAFRSATEMDPTYADAWYMLGACLTHQDRESEADAAYRRALELRGVKIKD